MIVKVIGEGRQQDDGKFSYKCELESGFKTLVYNCPKDLEINDKIEAQIFNKRTQTSRCGLVADFEFVKLIL